MITKSSHHGNSTLSSSLNTPAATPIKRVKAVTTGSGPGRTSRLMTDSARDQQDPVVESAGAAVAAVAAPQAAPGTCPLCTDRIEPEDLPYRIVLHCTHQASAVENADPTPRIQHSHDR